jgi:hypothetical protein
MNGKADKACPEQSRRVRFEIEDGKTCLGLRGQARRQCLFHHAEDHSQVAWALSPGTPDRLERAAEDPSYLSAQDLADHRTKGRAIA